MKTVIINKKILSLVVLGIIGFSILFLYRQEQIKEPTVAPGTPVSTPAAGEVLFSDGGEIPGELATGDLTAGHAVNADADFYVEYRLARERTRGQRVEWLREVINNAGSSEATRQKAQESLLSISSCMAKEVELENLIKAKGYSDAAVLVDSKSVTAVVASGSLPAAEAGCLTDLLARGTGVDPENIMIIPKY